MLDWLEYGNHIIRQDEIGAINYSKKERAIFITSKRTGSPLAIIGGVEPQEVDKILKEIRRELI